MPPERHRRRFRRPGTGRWLTESLPALRLELASTVRTTLTAWMRLYGEANKLPGLATGPIETRFARLRKHAGADSLAVWTTPTWWAAGEGLSLRVPDLQLEFTCQLGEGRLTAQKVAQVPDDARSPDREPGAVGVFLQVEHLELPPDRGEEDREKQADAGVMLLEGHFSRLAGRRWGGFVEPLRQALEAEAEDDEERTQRLTTRYGSAAFGRGGDEDVWKMSGVSPEPLRLLDDGEWLEILDPQGRSMVSARVIHVRPSEGTLEVGVRGSSDPPKGGGFIRPRSRRKIIEQKRALLDELESPTGSLPHLVRLVAAPSSLSLPRQVRPERFINPVVLRNRSQARAVALALGLEEGQAILIQGPPGTGKSTTAAEINVQLISRDPGVRILVCSHSNHGTDNMLMKVLPFLEDAQERIARVGFFDRIAREARPYYCPPDADLGDRNVVFTTIDALALQDMAGASLYDYVILDEANRAGVLDSLLALARGRRMILVGDAMQLQPVMSEAEQELLANQVRAGGRKGRQAAGLAMAARPGAQNVIGKSLFAWLLERRFAPGATVLLDQQNRMHPAIGDLVSRVFYGGKVRNGPGAPRRGTGIPLFPSPVTWVDTRHLRGNQESRGSGTSVFNVAEGRLVNSITRYLTTHAPPNLTIGVIAAYAEQKELLRRLLADLRADGDVSRQLEIDTVDAFEGREKDIIVLSLVRSNRRRDIGFLRLEQRLNVAVSRARRSLIIAGDAATLRSGYFHHLIATAANVGQILPAPKVAGQLGERAIGGARKRDRFERRGARRDGSPPAAGEVVPGSTRPEKGEGGDPDASQETSDSSTRPGEGRRNRRRRAWERRRERLRRERLGQVAQDGTPGQENGARPESAMSDTVVLEPPATTFAVRESAVAVQDSPVAVARRPRRARRPAPAEAPPESVSEADTEAPVEKPRRARAVRKRVAEPAGDPPIPAEATPQKARRVRRSEIS